MQTSFRLTIDREVHALGPEDVRNWDEIVCSYKRSDFDGVVRSFTSKFEFVNRGKELLWELYQKKGLLAEAQVTVLAQNDNLIDEEVFSCPLDFTSVEVEAFTLKINAVDNSFLAKIKAERGTKYEMTVGEGDLLPDGTFVFDRLPMMESATYKLTKGRSYDDSSDLLVTFREKEETPWVGLITSEIAVNGNVYFKDDQEDTDSNDSYLLQAFKEVNVTLDYDLQWLTAAQFYTALDTKRGGVSLSVKVYRNGMEMSDLESVIAYGIRGGVWRRVATVNNSSQLDPVNSYGDGAEREWMYALVGGIVWRSRMSGGGYIWSDTGQTPREYFTEKAQGRLVLRLQPGDIVKVVNTDAGYNLPVRFVNSEMKFRWNAKGDVVEIPAFKPETVACAILQKMMRDYPAVSISHHDPRITDTYIMAAESIRGIEGAKLYSSFGEFCDWMSAVFGYVYYFDEIERYIRFVHRSELFKDSAAVKQIPDARDVSYKIDSSVIYSTVKVGYEKKDYGSVNGRDEFNFNSTYSTDVPNTEKTLSLISKYRADSYGIEFTAQKRGEDTTDNKADQDVFFVLTQHTNGTRLSPDRTYPLQGVMNQSVFNAQFAPPFCLSANAGYIGMMGAVTLRFASSEGNSEVIIHNVRFNQDYSVGGGMLTAGELSFTTDDVDDIADVNEMVEVSDLEGNTYRGFLKEIDINYATSEAAKYKIIVKEIIQ